MSDGRCRKRGSGTGRKTFSGEIGLSCLVLAVFLVFALLVMPALADSPRQMAEKRAENVGNAKSDRLYTLSVSILPDTKSGSVLAVGAQINCPGKCNDAFPGGVEITLVPQPAKGWVFDCWSMEMKAGKPSDGADSVQTDTEKNTAPSPMISPIESHDFANALFVEIFSNLTISAVFKPQNESDGKEFTVISAPSHAKRSSKSNS